MAYGGNRPLRTDPYSFIEDPDDIRRQRRVYSERETHVPTRNFSQMQMNDDETGSQTRQRLEEVEREIAREEDSATIVRSPPSPAKHAPSTREKIQKSEEKLRLIHARKNEISQLVETIKRSQTVDLCFLIDCTGSMDPYIVQVKTRMDDLVAHCHTTFPDLVLRVAFVGYRDHSEEAERILSFPFTANIASFKSFVSNIRAFGGGDAAEDVFGGLEEVGKLQWSAPTRILFHVADAPCHGKQYHNDVYDEFPNGDPRGLHARDLLNVLEGLKVKYWFAKLTDKTDKMIIEFKRLLRMATMLEQVRKLSNNTAHKMSLHNANLYVCTLLL